MSYIGKVFLGLKFRPGTRGVIGSRNPLARKALGPGPRVGPALGLVLGLALGLGLAAGCSDSSTRPAGDCGGLNDLPPCRVTGVVLDDYPHDPQAFTQGLEIYDGVLYESTGQYGSSTLRKVNLTTGEVMQSIDLPHEVFGEGLTILSGKIFVLTWKSETGYVFDQETLAPIDTFTYEGEGWGLTHDANRLIMSNGTSVLQFLDPETLEVTGTVDVVSIDEDGSKNPVSLLNELEYVDGFVYSNRFTYDTVLRIYLETGVVTQVIDFSQLTADTRTLCSGFTNVFNGIAYDHQEDQFYVTGKYWCLLYRVTR